MTVEPGRMRLAAPSERIQNSTAGRGGPVITNRAVAASASNQKRLASIDPDRRPRDVPRPVGREEEDEFGDIVARARLASREGDLARRILGGHPRRLGVALSRIVLD